MKVQRSSIQTAQSSLRLALGRTDDAPLNVQGSLDFTWTPPVKSPDWSTLAEKHPEYLQQLCQLEAAKTQKQGAWADFSPTVYANASLGRNGPDWPPAQESWSTGLSLSWTLFNGGKRWANLYFTQAAIDQAQAMLDSLRQKLRHTLLSDYAAFQNAVENIDVTKQFLIATEERAKISEAQYSTGLITFDNWILIEDDLVSAKKNLLNAQAQALNAQAEWLHARGGAENE